MAAFIERTQADATLPADVKEKVIAALTTAKQQLESADRFVQLADRLKNIETDIVKAKAQLNELSSRPAEALPAAAPPEQIHKALAVAQVQLADAEKALTQAEQQVKMQAGRRQELPKTIAQRQKDIDDLGKQLLAPALPDVPQRLRMADRVRLRAMQKNLEEQLSYAQRDLAAFEDRTELFKLQRDAAKLQRDRLARAVDDLTRQFNAANAATNARLEEEALAAEKEAQGDPLTAAVATENLRLLERLNGPPGDPFSGIQARSTTAAERATAIAAMADDLGAKAEHIQQRIEKTGLTGVIGAVLQQHRAEVFRARAALREAAADPRELAEAQLAVEYLERRHAALLDLDREVQRRLAAAAATPERRSRVEPLLREGLQRQRDCLERLAGEYGKYIDALVRLDVAGSDLKRIVKQYGDFIDEKILWVRSGPPLGSKTPDDLTTAAAWLTDGPSWRRLVDSVLRDSQESLYLPVVGLLLALGAIAFRGRLASRLERLSGQAGPVQPYAMRRTVEAVAISLAVAVSIPAVPAILGWRLGAAADSQALPTALGEGLLWCAFVLLAGEALRSVCLPGGLGETHFNWDGHLTRRLRRRLPVIEIVAAACVVLIGTAEAQESAAFRHAIGRCAFMVLMLAMAVPAM